MTQTLRASQRVASRPPPPPSWAFTAGAGPGLLRLTAVTTSLATAPANR
ncbi:hypothetical protein ACFC18_44240 [Streptomyces sp. NPDC056121]